MAASVATTAMAWPLRAGWSAKAAHDRDDHAPMITGCAATLPPTGIPAVVTNAQSPKDAADLQEKVAFLRSPAAYPDTCSAVEAHETHMSWVFLADGFAWKLKKPVRYPFLDYRTPEARHRFCQDELRLNRRLAPGVYLDVVPLLRRPDGALGIGGVGQVVDWLVRMRRLPAALMLDAALDQGSATRPAVTRTAAHVAAFYAAAIPELVADAAYLDRFRHEIALTGEVLRDGAHGMPDLAPALVIGTLETVLASGTEWLLAPLRSGHIVEGHGDLRPEHVFLGDPPAVIDCLEFDRALRLLDPFEEMAFLAMECRMLGGAWAGGIFLHRVAAALGRRPPAGLLAFYTAIRACLRARLSLAHLQEPKPREPAKWRPRARRYMAEAAAACARLRRLRQGP
jgi:aminoglycoside phosphotransferase family enzyme